jgi:hypothetical protein
MKIKNFFSAVMSVIMLCFLLPLSALPVGAEPAVTPDYTLVFSGGSLYKGDPNNPDNPYQGETVPSESPDLGGGYYDLDGSTLTLSGIYFTTSAETALAFNIDGSNITLNLIGQSSFASTANSHTTHGISVGGELTIQGSGSLSATGGSGDYSYGIFSTWGITINSGTVRATGGSAESSYGMSADETHITINGGTVTSSGSSQAFESYATYTFPALYKYKDASTDLAYTNSADTPLVYGYENNAAYIEIVTLPVLGYTLTLDENGNLLDGDGNRVESDDLGGGSYSWDPDEQVLTITDIEFITSAPTALDLSEVRGVTLALVGTNSFTSVYRGEDETIGIHSNELYIYGTGSLLAKGGTMTGYSHFSVGINPFINLTIYDGTVTAIGGTSATESYGIAGEVSVYLYGGSLTAEGDDYGLLTGFDNYISDYTWTADSEYGTYPSDYPNDDWDDYKKVTINQSTSVDPSSPTFYDEYSGDLELYLYLSAGCSFSGISRNSTDLTLNTDYTYADGLITISADYLNAIGDSDTEITLVIDITGGDDITVPVTIETELPTYEYYIDLYDGELWYVIPEEWTYEIFPNEPSDYLGGGQYSYDDTTGTLTLTNVNFTTSYSRALVLYDDVTLNLVGANSFTSVYSGGSNTYGIRSQYNLTIEGSGSLQAKAGNGANNYGIYSVDDNIMITGGTVIASGSAKAFSPSPYTLPALYYYKDDITDTEYTSSADTPLVYSDQTYVEIAAIPVSDYTLSLNSNGKLYNGLTEIASGSDDLGNGTYTWNGINKTLTFTDIEFITTAATALDLSAVTDVKLNLVGTNAFTSIYDGAASTYGMKANGLMIDGSGSIQTNGGNSSGGNSNGYYSTGVNLGINGGTALFIGGNSTVSGGISYGVQVSGGQLKISGPVNFTAQSGTAQFRSIAVGGQSYLVDIPYYSYQRNAETYTYPEDIAYTALTTDTYVNIASLTGISPLSSAIDKDTLTGNLEIAYSLENGTDLQTIENGTNILRENTDYTKSAGVISIKNAYLKSLLSGSYTLKFNTSGIIDPELILTVTGEDPAPEPAPTVNSGNSNNSSSSSNNTPVNITPIQEPDNSGSEDPGKNLKVNGEMTDTSVVLPTDTNDKIAEAIIDGRKVNTFSLTTAEAIANGEAKEAFVSPSGAIAAVTNDGNVIAGGNASGSLNSNSTIEALKSAAENILSESDKAETDETDETGETSEPIVITINVGEEVTAVSDKTLEKIINTANEYGIAAEIQKSQYSEGADGEPSELIYRITLPVDESNLQDIHLGAEFSTKVVEASKAAFEKKFGNTDVVGFALVQKETYGTDAKVEVKMSAIGFEAKAGEIVYVAIFDPKTGKFTQIEGKIGENGFIEFYTEISGIVIISATAFTK